MKVELSVIIVSYETPELLYNCVSSIIRETKDFSYEIIVVDNSPNDGGKEKITKDFPTLRWIDSGYNAGFSRANNMGIKAAKGEYVLILNPDTEIKGDFLKTLTGFYRKNDTDGKLGQLTCRIISLKDGSLLIGSGRRFYGWRNELEKNPVYIFFRRRFSMEKKYNAYQMHYTNHEVDFASGACVMISRKKLEEKNLFLDEDFFLYWEDVEWSFRIKKAGLRNYFCADTEVYHVNSASTSKTDRLNRQIILSRWFFAYKSERPFVFWWHRCLHRINHMLIRWLLRRSGQQKELDLEEEEYAVFKDNISTIINDYQRSPSLGKQYLKYVSKTNS